MQIETLLPVAISIVFVWIACGTAVALIIKMSGVSDLYHIRKYGCLPSAGTETIYFALIIVAWPRAFWRMCK